MKVPAMPRLGLAIAAFLLGGLSIASAESLLPSYGASASGIDVSEFPITVDLTQPFHTRNAWTLKISYGNSDIFSEDPPLQICFSSHNKQACVSNIVPDCAALSETSGCFVKDGYQLQFQMLYDVRTVKPKTGRPLLVLDVSSEGGDGPYEPSGPIVFAYNTKTDSFNRVFTDTRSGNTNGDIRVLKSGPLAGDIIADEATSKRPYPYKIILYRPSANGSYHLVLSYLGQSRWGDGNSLGVLDAEMPEIMRRMGVWNASQALPVPSNNPFNCTNYMRKKGIEWCGGTAS